MNMPLKKASAIALPAAVTAQVLPLGSPRRTPLGDRLRARIHRGGARHPAAGHARADPAGGAPVLEGGRDAAAAVALKDTWGLIVDPFFDHGGIDKGCSGISRRACSASRSARSPPPSASRSARWLFVDWAMRGLDRSSGCCAPCRRSRGCRRLRRSATDEAVNDLVTSSRRSGQ
jgi:hypothetical protein